MVSLILRAIIQALNGYILSNRPFESNMATEDPVILDNIAHAPQAGGDRTFLDNKVVVTIVNVNEESTVKNNFPIHIENGSSWIQHPILHVNLYVLFAAHFSSYESAINHSFRVMEFFQANKAFHLKNMDGPWNEQAGTLPLELTMDLHSLSFEQINDLWGSLGGKQMPFALYKARLIPLRAEQAVRRTGVIREIDLSSNFGDRTT